MKSRVHTHRHIYPTVTDVSFLPRVQADALHPISGYLFKMKCHFGATAFMYLSWLPYIQILYCHVTIVLYNKLPGEGVWGRGLLLISKVKTLLASIAS